MDDKVVEDLLKDVQMVHKRLVDIMEDLRVQREFQDSRDLLAIRQQGNDTGAQNAALSRKTDKLQDQSEQILSGVMCTNDTLCDMIFTHEVSMQRVAEREARESAKETIDNHTIFLLLDQFQKYRSKRSSVWRLGSSTDELQLKAKEWLFNTRMRSAPVYASNKEQGSSRSNSSSRP